MRTLAVTTTVLLLLVARCNSSLHIDGDGSDDNRIDDQKDALELVPLLENLDAFYSSPLPALPAWMGTVECGRNPPSSDTRVRRFATNDALLAQFHTACFEKRPCIVRGWAQNNTKGDARLPFKRDGCSVEALEKVLDRSSGSWLLEELSDDKRLRCSRSDRSPSTAGCEWRDRHRSTLPDSYFSGPSGMRAFSSIRGSLNVQRDVVLGDTRGPREAEEELANHLNTLRQSQGSRRKASTSSSSSPSGAEWLALATRWNQTLILRDADGRDRRMWALGQRVHSDFAEFSSQSASGATIDTKENGGGPEVGVSLYLTPPGCTSTVPPHLDTMDVFAVQCEGRKAWTLTIPHRRWFLPTAPAVLPLRQDIHFYRDRATRQPLSQHVVLQPGDVLYIPRGVIHNTSTALFLDAVSSRCWGTEGTDAAPVPSLHASVGLETEPHFTALSLLEHATRWSHSSPARHVDAALSDVLFAASLTTTTKPMCTEHQEFMVLALRRALLHALSQHIVSLRRSAMGNRTAWHAQLAFNNIVSLLSVRSSSRTADERHRNVLVASRRWKQLLDDALGSERTLRETQAWWWPTHSGVPHGPTTGSDTSELCPMPPEFHSVSSFLKDTAATALRRHTAMERHGEQAGDMGGAVDRLTLNLFGFLAEMARKSGGELTDGGECCTSLLVTDCTTSLTSVTADRDYRQWMESGMQQLHEDRIAFAEWLDINDRLVHAP